MVNTRGVSSLIINASFTHMHVSSRSRAAQKNPVSRYGFRIFRQKIRPLIVGPQDLSYTLVAIAPVVKQNVRKHLRNNFD